MSRADVESGRRCIRETEASTPAANGRDRSRDEDFVELGLPLRQWFTNTGRRTPNKDDRKRMQHANIGGGMRSSGLLLLLVSLLILALILSLGGGGECMSDVDSN